MKNIVFFERTLEDETSMDVFINRKGEIVKLIRWTETGQPLMKWFIENESQHSQLIFFEQDEKMTEHTFTDIPLNLLNIYGDPTKNEYDEYGKLTYTEVYTSGVKTIRHWPIEGAPMFPMVERTIYADNTSIVVYYGENGEKIRSEKYES